MKCSDQRRKGQRKGQSRSDPCRISAPPPMAPPRNPQDRPPPQGCPCKASGSPHGLSFPQLLLLPRGPGGGGPQDEFLEPAGAGWGGPPSGRSLGPELEGSSQQEVKPETCEKKARQPVKPKARQRHPAGGLGPGMGRSWGTLGGWASRPASGLQITDAQACEPRTKHTLHDIPQRKWTRGGITAPQSADLGLGRCGGHAPEAGSPAPNAWAPHQRPCWAGCSILRGIPPPGSWQEIRNSDSPRHLDWCCVARSNCLFLSEPGVPPVNPRFQE